MSSLGDLLLAYRKGAKASNDGANDGDSSNTRGANQQPEIPIAPHDVEPPPIPESLLPPTSCEGFGALPPPPPSPPPPPPDQAADPAPRDSDAYGTSTLRSRHKGSLRQRSRDGANDGFSERIERDEADETRSNASSTDDLVQELLEPGQRPKNVWHVVGGPKVQPGEDSQPARSPADNDDGSSQGYDFPALPPETSLKRPHEDQRPEGGDQKDAPASRRDADEDLKHGDRDNRDRRPSRDRTEPSHRRRRTRSPSPGHGAAEGSVRDHSPAQRNRDRSSSSRRHRHHDRGDRSSYDRDRDHDRDRDRHRSGRRRRDESDDDDDSRRRRQRDSRDRRHKDRMRSRSRSPKRSSRSRRDRSKSASPSPLTKRNSRTILIMQLAPRVTSRDLEDFFSDIGRVREVRLIMDSKARRHKGIAYIEFEDASSAARAFDLNGQKFMGAPMVIQSAQMDRKSDYSSSFQQSANPSSFSYGGGSRSNPAPNSYRVYAGALHMALTEEMLRSIFEPFGPLLRLELMRDRVTNASRGYAFITFANIEDGQYAVQCLDGLELGGKPIKVSKSQDKSERHATTSHTHNITGWTP